MAKSKTALAIESVFAARTIEELDQLAKLALAALPQKRQKDQVMQAGYTRKYQLQNAPSYRIGSDNICYLRLVIEGDITGYSHAYVVNFDTPLMKGRYMIANDRYRMHCAPMPHLPIGCYHLDNETAYLVTGKDETQAPFAAKLVAMLNPAFMSRGKWVAKTSLLDCSFTFNDSKLRYVRLSATADKQLKFGGAPEDHCLPQILDVGYIMDATDDRDCVFLLGYATTEPIAIVDSNRRIAFVQPCNPAGTKMRKTIKVDDDDAIFRKRALCSMVTAFYGSTVSRTPDGTAIGDQTFKHGSKAIRHYLYEVVEFNEGTLEWVETSTLGKAESLRYYAHDQIRQEYYAT